MAEPRLLALGRAAPEARYTQEDLLAHNPWEGHGLVERLFRGSPVHRRGLFVPPGFYHRRRSLTETNDAWRQGAMSLAGRALDEGLARSGVAAGELDVIGVTTVTGYATPGLDLLLAKAHGLSPSVQRAHFNCIGCHAAVPLLRVISDHVARRPGQLGAAVAVEVCSACFAPSDDPQNLVALSLFADGAACAIVGTEGEGPAIVDFESVFDLDHLDALGFDLGTQGFSIVLDPKIPELVARGIDRAVRTLLGRHGLQPGEVGAWCLHPGGSRVLDAAQRALELPDAALRHSRAVLQDHGNMSSPSVLFVLAEQLAHDPPPPGAPVVLAAFGPGLGVEAALLRA